MGARSERFVVRQPYPVVYDAFISALPSFGIRVIGADPARGRIEAETRRDRITLSLGAIDAVTTEWVADIELKVGLGPDRHAERLLAIRHALDSYLGTYYAT